MFLTRGWMPHLGVWEEWLKGADGLLPVPAVGGAAHALAATTHASAGRAHALAAAHAARSTLTQPFHAWLAPHPRTCTPALVPHACTFIPSPA
jgi:hypothetical protein